MPTFSSTTREWVSLLAVLLGVLVLLHGGLVWGGQVLCGGDIVNHAHPLTLFWTSGPWLQGWCPYSFSGRPFFADVQSAVLYPPRWLFRAGFSVEYMTTFLCLAHSLFGAVGVHLLLRIRFGFLPGLLGAVLWLAGGYTLLRYTNGVVTLIYALSWVPWVWWALELCGPRRPAMTAFLALSAALLFLAGSPQVVFIAAFGFAIWAVGRLLFDEDSVRGRLALAAHFAVAGVFALLVVFPQLHASAEYTAAAVGRGGRAQWDYLVADSLGPWLLISNLAPEFFEPGNSEGLYWGSGTGFMETNAYIGIAPLLLAAFGILAIGWTWSSLDRSARRWFVCLVVLFLIGLFVAFGRFTPIYQILYNFIPGFNLFRVPARWLLWPFLSAIILSAWGLEILVRQLTAERSESAPPLMKIWGIVSAALIIGTLLLLLFVEPVMKLCGFQPAALPPEIAQLRVATSRGALSWALLLAVMSAAVGSIALSRRLPILPAAILLLVITVLDFARFWQPYRQPLPHEDFTRQEIPTETIYHKIEASAFREWFTPETELTQLLQSSPEGRYFYTDWLYSYLVDEYTREIYTERGMAHGLENMRGYQPLQIESYATEFATISAVETNTAAAVGSFLHAPIVADREMLDAYNATRILTYEASLGDAESRERLQSLGLQLEATFPFRLEVWRNPHAPGWAWMSSGETWPALESRLPDATVATRSRRAGESTYAVEVPEGGGWLHFSEVSYPGWQIHVAPTDNPDDVVITTGRSVRIAEAGSYTVTHLFRIPTASRFTLPLSGFAAFLLLSFIGWQGMRVRKRLVHHETKNPTLPL